MSAPLTKRQRQALRRAGAAGGGASPGTAGSVGSHRASPSSAPSPAAEGLAASPSASDFGLAASPSSASDFSASAPMSVSVSVSPPTSVPPPSQAQRRSKHSKEKEKEKDVREEGREEREQEKALMREERASPSKYPTPLPDEEEEEEGYDLGRGYHAGDDVRRDFSQGAGDAEGEEGVVGAMEIDGDAVEGEWAGEVDGGEEEEQHLMDFDAPLAVAEPPSATARDLDLDGGVEDPGPPQPNPLAQPREQPRRREPGIDREATIRASSSSSSSSRPRPRMEGVGGGGGGGAGRQERQHQQQQHAHLRAPEVPRPPPPRALSALSHTRRALEAVTSGATAAYESAASAYSAYSHSHSHEHSHAHSSSAAGGHAYAYGEVQGPRRGEAGGGGGGARDAGRRDGGGGGGVGRGGEDEVILGVRWDEVEVEVEEREGEGGGGGGVGDGSHSTSSTHTVKPSSASPPPPATKSKSKSKPPTKPLSKTHPTSTAKTRSKGKTQTKRLLTLTYAGGVQVWDASGLGAGAGGVGTGGKSGVGPVGELLNLRIPSVEEASARKREEAEQEQEGGTQMQGPAVQAGVLPSCAKEGMEGGGLEMGVLTPHALYIYSLALGRVVAVWRPDADAEAGDKRDGLGGTNDGVGIGTPCAFEAAGGVVVVATHSPPALVILARPSLDVLHVFPASAIAVPPPPSVPTGVSPSSYTNGPGNRASYGDTSTSPPFTGTSPPHTDSSPTPSNASPIPTFALHGRLLAFLAPQPAAAPPATDGTKAEKWGRSIGGSIGRFFSRSAPAASALATSAAGLFAGSPGSPGAAALASVSSALSASSSALLGAGGGAGAWVRIVDLRALENGEGGVRDVHAFQAGRAAVGALAFAKDGTRLFVVRRDGLGAGVWGVRPGSPGMELGTSPESLAAPAQLYELRRGRTGAVVEGVAGARDGRFIALATRRRTVHIFAVNPYGGRADVRSHLGARVRDGEVVTGEEQPTEVHPLVRIRMPPPPQALHHPNLGEPAPPPPPPPAPLAIAFVPPAAVAAAAHPLRSPVSPASPGTSGVQDVLVFDPADGVLSLRRVTIALEAPHAAGLPISMSLPTGRLGMGTSLSASPPAYAASHARGHHAAAGVNGGGEMTSSTELSGRESVVATWSLRRRRGWAEIRRVESAQAFVEERPVKEDWLAQAELSTFSSAPHVLPRPIYLSHQFSFHALGEDYHALIRRYQFAIGGAKIEVRREVEVSAFAAGGAGGESFVEGYASSPRAIQRRSRASSSFDEPLASALAGAHYARPPPVLPMLPNGSPASFRSSMPIRAVAGLGDGVAEGLVRLRREMRHQRQKQLARSPPVRGKGGDDIDASVPLEFDEEDEDFVVPPSAEPDVFLRVHADREDDDALSATTSRNGDSVASVSTPATSAHPLEDEERLDSDLGNGAEGEVWHGWASEDKLAVEEAERFDDISVVGFLDEEQAAMKAEAERRKGMAARGRKRRN